jgi:heptosyltransferase-2
MADQQDRETDRILVIRLSSLGDILLTASALRALRTRFPFAQIDFLTSSDYAEIAACLPGIDHVLEFNKRAGTGEFLEWQSRLFRTRYSLLIDLQNSFRSAIWRTFAFPSIWIRAKRHRLKRFLLIHLRMNFYHGVLPVPLRYLTPLESLGCKDDGQGLELYVSETARKNILDKLNVKGIPHERLVILCPGARHTTKRWPYEKWTELGRVLLEKNHPLLLLGDEEDRSLIETITNGLADNRVGSIVQPLLVEAAACLQMGACAISNDSGLMHLAIAVRTPVVAIFGPTVEEFGFFPFRAKAEVVQEQLSCRPCSAMGGERCPKRHFKCMQDISVSRVIDAAFRLMEHNESVPANCNS